MGCKIQLTKREIASNKHLKSMKRQLKYPFKKDSEYFDDAKVRALSPQVADLEGCLIRHTNEEMLADKVGKFLSDTLKATFIEQSKVMFTGRSKAMSTYNILKSLGMAFANFMGKKFVFEYDQTYLKGLLEPAYLQMMNETVVPSILKIHANLKKNGREFHYCNYCSYLVDIPKGEKYDKAFAVTSQGVNYIVFFSSEIALFDKHDVLVYRFYSDYKNFLEGEEKGSSEKCKTLADLVTMIDEGFLSGLSDDPPERKWPEKPSLRYFLSKMDEVQNNRVYCFDPVLIWGEPCCESPHYDFKHIGMFFWLLQGTMEFMGRRIDEASYATPKPPEPPEVIEMGCTL